MQIARSRPSELTLLHVEAGVVPLFDEELGVLEPNRMMNLMELESLITKSEESIEHKALVQYGDPATVILDVAKEHTIDLIVLGTHGRSGLSRLLLGSVAETVLRNATCNVLLVSSVGDPATERSTENVDANNPSDTSQDGTHRGEDK